jgi:hypothetical protein
MALFKAHRGVDLTDPLETLLNLKHDGDIAYVMKRGDALWTMLGNNYGGGSKWVQIAGPNPGETMDPGKAKLKGAVETSEVVETVEEQLKYELGWYQDQKANLFKYDGEQWTDGRKTVAISKAVYETLEFLG